MIKCDKCKRNLSYQEKQASWHLVLQTDTLQTFNEIDLCPRCIDEVTRLLTERSKDEKGYNASNIKISNN